MEDLYFRWRERMVKGDLGFALLAGFCPADAAATVFILKKRIITAARACELSIFLDKDLYGYACKGQCNQNYRKKNNEHNQIYRFYAKLIKCECISLKCFEPGRQLRH